MGAAVFGAPVVVPRTCGPRPIAFFYTAVASGMESPLCAWLRRHGPGRVTGAATESRGSHPIGQNGVPFGFSEEPPGPDRPTVCTGADGTCYARIFMPR